MPPNSNTSFTLLSSVSSDGIINIWNLNNVLSFGYKGDNTISISPLTTYDTKNRLTCVVLSQKFDAQGLDKRDCQQDT